MAKNISVDLAWENLHKCMNDNDWRESDEIILVSRANQEEIESYPSFREGEECAYYGDRICIFATQLKKNNYITLHKAMLKKAISIMEKKEK